ncbi:MAG: adenosylmethionine decarboxylase [Candidatus Brocadia sp. AMX2]|uniref:S-adenosylmethionine decarboxylase proenzyme n=1 Tax=Candidatus Brocadia sinica JPN1 TaxID=1197129 RepID=A0ABQ0K2M5_9BACT|nr:MULTISPECIES: adenosylmethionine decarboxylase [Brocadia]KXK27537.1 MAG: S-adenosylmethionine decarboxylase proenzyme [Candidatus Brocadia sinica]MBC6933712.1 adenosylmethionine decarboxylase [Candidatus Brocadia sp.]MBL1168740.1 adenosylmethionine decarboxylase [Candidatus Brocadia sp. AMX1]NOG42799.1 adenosylmethionine decarboxylase [Planctomycetota bacterium]KAA0242986.1 MAG: adenosylmethionine decarboxylase [Candidatus Brocadia sp. AMX2]
MDALGRHIILEMWGCCHDIIDNVDVVKEILMKATKSIQATLVDIVCHRFSPYGVTGVAILAESHISVHTWPEYGYAAADVFICGGNTINPQNAASFIIQAFHAKETSLLELERGNLASRKIQGGKTVEMNVNIPGSRSPICL